MLVQRVGFEPTVSFELDYESRACNQYGVRCVSNTILGNLFSVKPVSSLPRLLIQCFHYHRIPLHGNERLGESTQLLIPPSPID